MKILYTSDLHLDFISKNKIKTSHFQKIFFEDFDLCIIAGDFSNFNNIYHENTLQQFSKLINEKPLIFIAGNHDYYFHADFMRMIRNDFISFNFGKINEYFKALEKSIKNFYFLNNTSITIQDINFFGGTAWSKANEKSFIPENDYHFINPYPYKNIKEMNAQEHKLFLIKLESFLNKNKGGKNIVISHFSPSETLRNYNYENKTEFGMAIDKYFSNNFDKILLSDLAPNYWFYGHNHFTDKKQFNHCTALSNQSGYPSEGNNGIASAKIIEVF